MPAPESLCTLLQDDYTSEALQAIDDLLAKKETLKITPLASGLFSAATTTEFSAVTNYHAVWVRDNVHVAYAHHVTHESEIAAAAARALARFFRSQASRFQAVIDDPRIKERETDAMWRPHIRFNGENSQELPEVWAHAQNDALGGFLWLYATLAIDGVIPWTEWDFDVVGFFVKYFQAIRYWEDEDSGHWEEGPKISASSIGVVVAGLRKLREWAIKAPELISNFELLNPNYWMTGPVNKLHEVAQLGAALDQLIESGNTALSQILPAECAQDDPEKNRRYDAALLFLIYPFDAVSDDNANDIVRDIRENLEGTIGIKRYPGDSFYCTDYERKVDDPTRDYSQDIARRNKIFQPGDEEAQWCIFDSTLSVHFGRRFQRGRQPEDLARQTTYFNRALRQITRDDPPRCKAFQCAELYYLENGRLQTSKSVPLLWSQANLRTAFEFMRRSIAVSSRQQTA
jgi:GH15 family glucan-1,4-alpha-glucosidase